MIAISVGQISCPYLRKLWFEIRKDFGSQATDFSQWWLTIASVFEAVTKLVGKPQSVTATGGFARSKVWRQMLADILDCQVNVPVSFESGCLGAAILVMQSIGIASSYDVVANYLGDEIEYDPQPQAVAVYKQLLPVFRQVEKLLAPAYPTIANLQSELALLHGED